MAEPLKQLYNQALVGELARELQRVYPAFDTAVFIRRVFNRDWPGFELKERMAHITRCLHAELPQDYPRALAILEQAVVHFDGFEYMFFPGFVERYGLDDFPRSVAALAHFTRHASSEFAVRPFIVRYGKRMMAQMLTWADADDRHLRRLASEGCRPRLPWAMALPEFKRDPAPVLPILEKLRDDESEYVRRSVANNLNDISKDHPQRVLDLAERWIGASARTDHLLKHALRGLLKQGDARALTLFGYTAPTHVSLSDFSLQPSVEMGEHLAFSFTLRSGVRPLGKLRVEYAIDFLRKNGRRNRKVFKLTEASYQARVKMLHKTHSFRPISTRDYYPGMQGLAILVNGEELAAREFQLKLAGHRRGSAGWHR